MKLMKLLAEVKEVEQEILEKYYQEQEDITDEETKLQLLQNQLNIKLRQYVHLIKNKFFEHTKEIIDNKIEDLQREKKYLDNTKQMLELALHNYVSNGEGAIEIIDDDGKVEYYLNADLSIRKSVNEYLIEDENKKYILPELDYKDYNLILDLLSNAWNFNLRSELEKSVKTKCLVTSLPKDHRAIVQNIRPTIKITKTKSKV